MLRWALAGLIATTSGAAALAQPTPGRAPVTVYLVDPPDRPDKPTIMTATSPKKAHEIKRCALTWRQAEFWYFNVGPDCQPSDFETTLVVAPKHGRFDFFETSLPTRGFGNPGFAKDDPRLGCVKLPIRSGSYYPEPGFTGRDYVTVAFRDGATTFTEAFEIDVRRPVRPSPLAAQ